jgi:hypothetical protein
MVEAHTCSGDSADAKVFVNGVRVPVTDVDIYMRKEGDTSMSRYAEGKIISPWEGVDYANVFDSIDEGTQTSYDTARIEVRDTQSQTFETAFRGMVTGFGNGGGIQREWNFRAQGPGQFLKHLPISKEFTDLSSLKLNTVTQFINNELKVRMGMPIDVGTFDGPIVPRRKLGTAGDAEGEGESGSVLPGGPVEFVTEGFGDSTDLQSPANSQHFQRNRDTMADLVSWVEDSFDVYTFFVHSTDPATFIATSFPHFTLHEAHYLDGGLFIENNDALSEIRPINTVTAKGEAVVSQEDRGLLNINATPSEYAFVKVRHTDLFRRAGGVELAAKDLEVNAKDKSKIANKAANHLKKEIDSASGGDMQVLPRTPVQPFDVVRAQPTCDGSAATETEPVEYEVHRVHHKIRAGEPSATVLDVGVHTNVENDIDVVKFGWRSI